MTYVHDEVFRTAFFQPGSPNLGDYNDESGWITAFCSNDISDVPRTVPIGGSSLENRASIANRERDVIQFRSLVFAFSPCAGLFFA